MSDRSILKNYAIDALALTSFGLVVWHGVNIFIRLFQEINL